MLLLLPAVYLQLPTRHVLIIFFFSWKLQLSKSLTSECVFMWMKAKLSFFFFLSFFFPNTHVRVDEVSGERLPHHEEANNSANRSWPGTTKDDSRCLRSAIVGCEEPFLARCWLTEELNSDEGKKKNKKNQHRQRPPPLALSSSHRLSFSVSEVMQ